MISLSLSLSRRENCPRARSSPSSRRARCDNAEVARASGPPPPLSTPFRSPPSSVDVRSNSPALIAHSSPASPFPFFFASPQWYRVTLARASQIIRLRVGRSRTASLEIKPRSFLQRKNNTGLPLSLGGETSPLTYTRDRSARLKGENEKRGGKSLTARQSVACHARVRARKCKRVGGRRRV